MKKRLAYILLAFIAVFTAVGCDACNPVVSAVLDDKVPWNMPTLYEKSVFTAEKYLMKSEDKVSVKDKLLSSGRVEFLLEEAGSVNGIPCAKLSMNMEITYNDDSENGADKSLTDKMSSEVVFQKVSLSPVSSVKTADLAIRKKADGSAEINDSYTVSTDYSEGVSKFVWTKRDGESQRSMNVKFSGQVFDNEQLYYAVRAFSALKVSQTQTFKLYNAFDSFMTNQTANYTMTLHVAADTADRLLTGWENENNYGFGSEADSTPKVECMTATLTKSDAKSGPAFTAYFSAVPFKITENIETSKVMTGFEQTEYNDDYSKSYKTFYSLVDYRAVNRD